MINIINEAYVLYMKVVDPCLFLFPLFASDTDWANEDLDF